MLRLRALILRVVQRQTAASNSASPEIIGQHALAAGSPTPMCTSPPNRSTHPPSFRVSIGQVSFPGGGGQGFFPGDGFLMTGGAVTGGTVTGGMGTGGILIGGLMTGGRSIGGLTGGRGTGGILIGGLTTGGRSIGGFTGGRGTGGILIGGLTMGGRSMGGFTGGRGTGGILIGGLTTGGRVMGGTMGPLGDLEPEPGLTFLGGGLPQEPQPKMGAAVERKSMQTRSRAWIFEGSILASLLGGSGSGSEGCGRQLQLYRNSEENKKTKTTQKTNHVNTGDPTLTLTQPCSQ